MIICRILCMILNANHDYNLSISLVFFDFLMLRWNSQIKQFKLKMNLFTFNLNNLEYQSFTFNTFCYDNFLNNCITYIDELKV